MIGWIDVLALLWTLMFSYGFWKTIRILLYTFRVRLYWEAKDDSAAMNAQTDVYTTDRLRSAALRFGSVFFFWLAGFMALLFAPAGDALNPAYLGLIPTVCLLIAGALIIADAIYADRALRELQRHDSPVKVRFSDEKGAS